MLAMMLTVAHAQGVDPLDMPKHLLVRLETILRSYSDRTTTTGPTLLMGHLAPVVALLMWSKRSSRWKPVTVNTLTMFGMRGLKASGRRFHRKLLCQITHQTGRLTCSC
jgi:hypothetical protein